MYLPMQKPAGVRGRERGKLLLFLSYCQCNLQFAFYPQSALYPVQPLYSKEPRGTYYFLPSHSPFLPFCHSFHFSQRTRFFCSVLFYNRCECNTIFLHLFCQWLQRNSGGGGDCWWKCPFKGSELEENWHKSNNHYWCTQVIVVSNSCCLVMFEVRLGQGGGSPWEPK